MFLVQQNISDAITQLQNIRKKYPQFAAVRFFLGVARSQNGELQLADRNFSLPSNTIQRLHDRELDGIARNIFPSTVTSTPPR